MNAVDDSRPRADLEAIGRATTELVETVYGSVTVIRDAFLELWTRMSAEGAMPGSTDFASLATVIHSELSAKAALLNGAGVVLADHVLPDRARHLEWWHPTTTGASEAQRLVVDLNPRSEYFYDYTHMEWFAVPRDQDRRWICGPYLDYTGVDLYVCTFSMPLRLADGTFLGIAGADISISTIESALWPYLQQASATLVLANADGRVIVGNDAEYLTGLRVGATARTERAVTVRATPWSLIVVRTAG
ncbi:cache domain-containing protein [Nocardia sp. NPDC004860]|uniref:cache domain-containing protein n=1 Tax=Nocardia sp. NPDC004860 TaxID=3154557 RepID=UPI0033BA07C7